MNEEASTLRPLRALFRRDLVLAMRLGAGGGAGVAFVLALAAVTPFAVGPDLSLLQRIGPAILWIAALLSMLLGLDRLFQADFEDGALDQLQLCDTPLEGLVAIKCAVHWLTSAAPVAIAAPLMGFLFAMDGPSIIGVFISLLAGTPALTFLGALGAAATVSLRRGGLILSLIAIPLCVPVLIFGVACAQAAQGGPMPWAGPLIVLAALSLAAAALCPFAAAALLRRIEG